MFMNWKSILILVFLTMVCCTGVSSAAVTEELNLTYQNASFDTDIQAVSAISSGGFYLGVMQGHEVKVIKTDAAGNEIWQKTFPGSEVRSMLTLDDGGCLLTTTTIYGVQYEDGVNGMGGNTTLIRVDKDGNTIFLQNFVDVGAGDLLVSGNQIKFAGWFWESMTGFVQSFSLSDGMPANDQMRLGSAEHPRVPLGMILESDGSLVLTGGTTASMYSESSEGWILKIKNGAVVFDTIVRTGSDNYLYGEGACGYAICKADNGYLIVGAHPPLRVTYAPGIAWAAFVDSNGKTVWLKDIDGCYAPHGVVPFGDEYLIAGNFGGNNPVWLTITSGGAITASNHLEVQGMYNDVALVSPGEAVIVGWRYEAQYAEGTLLTLIDDSVLVQEEGTSLWMYILGGVICVVVVCGVLYFAVLRKPIQKEKPKQKTSSAKKKKR